MRKKLRREFGRGERNNITELLEERIRKISIG